MEAVSQVMRQASELIVPSRPVLDLEHYIYQSGMFVSALMNAEGTGSSILLVSSNLN